jgi:hypothetical protein
MLLRWRFTICRYHLRRSKLARQNGWLWAAAGKKRGQATARYRFLSVALICCFFRTMSLWIAAPSLDGRPVEVVVTRIEGHFDCSAFACKPIFHDIDAEAPVNCAAVLPQALVQKARPTFPYFRQDGCLAYSERLRNIIEKRQIDSRFSQVEQQTGQLPASSFTITADA